MRLYYSDLTLTSNPTYAAAVLSAAPTIVRAAASASAGVTTFSAQVVGDPSAAIYETWITYTSGAGGSGTWTSINLQQCIAPLPAACGAVSDSQYWMAQVPTASLPADTKYIVQAASGTGLVSLDDNLGRYYSAGGSAASPLATAIAFNAPVPASAAYGSNLQVSATLSSAASPLAGKVVTIALAGSARTGTSNASGVVTVQIPVLSPPGSYPLTASFGGDDAYLPSAITAATQVTVTKAATTLSLLTGANGVTLMAGAQPLIQESVQFLVAGPQGTQQLFAITDFEGRATIPPPGLPSGTYTILQACYAGNATYAAAKLYASLACATPTYAFTGFFQPVDNPPTLNVVKAGASVPVKFSLGGNRGLNVFQSGYPASQVVSCSGFTASSPIEDAGNAGSSSLQYDSATDTYTYVWKTDKAWAGTCRILLLYFNDGTQKVADFQFKS